MAFKLVINNPKDGKSYQMDFEDKSKLIGKKLGEKVSGSVLGLSGYELKITGGSDACGNPIRSDVDGSSARRLILTGGAGLNPKEEGERRKKRIHGRTIAGDIIQINLKVVKSGSKKLPDLISSGEESEKKEEEEKEPEPKPKSEVEKKPQKKEEKKKEKKPEKKEAKEEKEKSAKEKKEKEKPQKKEKEKPQKKEKEEKKKSDSKETKNEKPKTNNDNKEA